MISIEEAVVQLLRKNNIQMQKSKVFKIVMKPFKIISKIKKLRRMKMFEEALVNLLLDRLIECTPLSIGIVMLTENFIGTDKTTTHTVSPVVSPTRKRKLVFTDTHDSTNDFVETGVANSCKLLRNVSPENNKEVFYPQEIGCDMCNTDTSCICEISTEPLDLNMTIKSSDNSSVVSVCTNITMVLQEETSKSEGIVYYDQYNQEYPDTAVTIGPSVADYDTHQYSWNLWTTEQDEILRTAVRNAMNGSWYMKTDVFNSSINKASDWKTVWECQLRWSALVRNRHDSKQQQYINTSTSKCDNNYVTDNRIDYNQSQCCKSGAWSTDEIECLSELVPQHFYVHTSRNIVMTDWTAIGCILNRDKKSCRNKYATMVNSKTTLPHLTSKEVSFTVEDDEIILERLQLFGGVRSDDLWIVLSAELNRDIGSIKNRMDELVSANTR